MWFIQGIQRFFLIICSVQYNVQTGKFPLSLTRKTPLKYKKVDPLNTVSPSNT